MTSINCQLINWFNCYSSCNLCPRHSRHWQQVTCKCISSSKCYFLL